MTIIFDSEEQKEQFVKLVCDIYCPSSFMLNESPNCLAGDGDPMICRECWNSSLKLEVKGE